MTQADTTPKTSTYCEGCSSELTLDMAVYCWPCFDNATEAHECECECECDVSAFGILANRVDMLADQMRDNRGELASWWSTARDIAAEIRAEARELA